MQRKILSIPEHLNIRALFEKRRILSWYFFGAPYPLMRLHFPSLLQSPKSEFQSKSARYPHHDVLRIFYREQVLPTLGSIFRLVRPQKSAVEEKVRSPSNFHFFEGIWAKEKLS
jgi:hypothetical protein